MRIPLRLAAEEDRLRCGAEGASSRMAGDLGSQVFNEKDLFTGEAAAEDGPCETCAVEATRKDAGTQNRDFIEKHEATPGDLLPEPSRSGGQSTGIINQSKEATPGNSRRPAAPTVQKAYSRLDGEAHRNQSSVVNAKASETSDVKQPRKSLKYKRAKMKQQRDCVLYWLETKYDVLPEILQAFSEEWQEASGPDDDVDLLWSDAAISVERFIKMQSFQKVNHFVGMTSITRKNNLGRNLLRMKKKFPDEYRFFPDTWILPTDLSDFKTQFNGKKNKTFIVKPSDGYQGRGIFLTRDFESIPLDYNSTLVVQRYIHKPWLLDGHKFDLRLYVLVTGCDPLRIFLHEHGLVRLASEEYQEPKSTKNLQRTMMHLTNYAINCDNPKFEENHNPQDGTDGHKRSLQAVLKEFEESGLNVQDVMAQIEDLIVKTLIAVQPSLSHVYHSCQPDDIDNAMCFEILGFDILLDCKAKPWLIEVNHAPSFRTETELDRLVKFQALYDAFELINVNPENRRRYKREQQQALEDRARGVAERRTAEERMILEEESARLRSTWEDSVKNGYRRLFPVEDKNQTQDYERYLEAAIDIWETMTGSNSRRKPKKDTEEESRRVASEDGGRRGERLKNLAKRQSSQTAGLASKVVADSGRSNGSSRRSRSAEKLPLAAAAAVALAGKAGTATSGLPGVASSAKPSASSRHADVEVGDVIQVQTNLGWEPVVVARKHDTGQLDIRFEDGETMCQVMPRILKRNNTNVSPSAGVPSASHLPSTSSMTSAPQRPDNYGGNSTYNAGQSGDFQHLRQGARSPGAVPHPPPPPTRPQPMSEKSSGVTGAGRISAAGGPASQRPINGSPVPVFNPSVSAAIASAVAAASATGIASGAHVRPTGAAGSQTIVFEHASPPAASSSIMTPLPAAASSTDRSAMLPAGAGTRLDAEGHSSAPDKSPWRPPARLPGSGPGSSIDPVSAAVPGFSPPSDQTAAATGDRCGSGGTAGFTETGLQDSDPATRRKFRQALRDESLQRLRQNLLAEHGTSAVASPERRSTPADLSVEARQGKIRSRVRPLLPPKGPSWSTAGGSANVHYRPALSIEARSVHPPTVGSRPRAAPSGELPSTET